jgi:macrodomain Ter protein organizer (MatP/YcbG family)
MSTPITFTGTTKVWTTSKWRDISYVTDCLAKGKTEELVGELNYINHDMSDTEDWVEVGVAAITVTLHPKDDIVAKELDGLNAQLQKVRAENQQRENAILDRISKLQAITYEAPEEF